MKESSERTAKIDVLKTLRFTVFVSFRQQTGAFILILLVPRLSRYLLSIGARGSGYEDVKMAVFFATFCF